MSAVVGGADDGVREGTLLAGRYRILRKLGEGAMGAVYLGEHTRIGRHDAIKVLRASLAGDAEAVTRFERGTRNVAAIQHPNVCAVYDFGDAEDGRRFLAMEYVPGETLQELLEREGPLPPARAVDIALQVAGALQAAHDARIVHRDLKPANVMVSPARGGGDAVKVVDFDIAKGSSEGEASDVTRFGFVIGTPEYMSPEQLLGMALDGRSDVYSLGLVLFRMLAGGLPYRTRDTQEMMLQRLTGSPLRLDEVLPAAAVPPALQAALDLALQRRAEDRFPSAAAFARAIAEALDEPAAPAPVLAAPEIQPPAPADPHAHEAPPPTVPSPRHPHPSSGDPPARGRLARVVGGTLVAAAVGVVGLAYVMGPSSGSSEDAIASAESAPPAKAAHAGTREILDGRADSVSGPVGGDPGTGDLGMGDPEMGKMVIADPAPRPKVAPDVNPPRPEPAPPPTAPPTPPPPALTPPALAASGGRDAGVVLDQLQDRVGPPYPARAELQRVREAAREVWGMGDAVPPTERARAAFILAHAELGLGNVEGCVRWAESATRLKPGGSRQVLLDECLRVREDPS